jgi:hypothetical protein
MKMARSAFSAFLFFVVQKEVTGMKLPWVLLAAVLTAAPVALAAYTQQSISCDKMFTDGGDNAIDEGQMETKEVEDAQDGRVARVKSSMNQWGYVSCWFGTPVPAGKSTVRLRIYVDGKPTARYNVYLRAKAGSILLSELKLPSDAKLNDFVDVDVPVESKEEWTGLTIKKADPSRLPSPWFDTISIVLPD